MAKASPAITSFNGGEFSPLLRARVDQEKYPNGADTLVNFIPTVQGPIKKRAGTRFVGETKDQQKALLIPFELSVYTTYVIELGHMYARFYTSDGHGGRGIVLGEDGNELEIATPYTLEDLFDVDGSSMIKHAQSGDVIYLCCPNHPVRTLKRLSLSEFTLTEFDHKNGPIEDLNSTETRVKVTSIPGNVEIESSTPIFKKEHEGSWFYIEAENRLEPWTVDAATWGGQSRRSDGKNYVALVDGYTGTVTPVHTRGDALDGVREIVADPLYRAIGINWRYTDSNYCYLKIKEVVSDKFVTAELVGDSRLPILANGAWSKIWAMGAWNAANGYPTSVAFFRSRLWFARGQNVWGSIAGGFDDYASRFYGKVTDDMAVSIKLSSGQVNNIQWLLPDKSLIAGTAGGEFSIGELSNGNAIGPNNIRAILQSDYGSKNVQPAKNGSSILFMQRAGLKAREFFYSITSEGYTSSDATQFSEHITRGDGLVVGNSKYYGVISMTVAQEPDPIIWMLRTDGKLIGFTWDNEQQVKGWHRHDLGGFIESITSVPSVDGSHEELWMCIRRSIGGVERYYIEYMENEFNPSDAPDEQYYLDCGLSYRGALTNGGRSTVSVIYGLSHLEGEIVSVLADGALQPPQVVESGRIELSTPASIVHVGLPYSAKYKSLRIEAGARDGTAQGKTKRIQGVTFRFDTSGECSYGVSFDDMVEVGMREHKDDMNKPAPLFTGDKRTAWTGGYDLDGQIAVMSSKPFALTLVGIFPQLVTQDR